MINRNEAYKKMGKNLARVANQRSSSQPPSQPNYGKPDGGGGGKNPGGRAAARRSGKGYQG